MKRTPIKVPVDWTDLVIHSVTVTTAGSAVNRSQLTLRSAGEILLNRATWQAMPRPRCLEQIGA